MGDGGGGGGWRERPPSPVLHLSLYWRIDDGPRGPDEFKASDERGVKESQIGTEIASERLVNLQAGEEPLKEPSGLSVFVSPPAPNT